MTSDFNMTVYMCHSEYVHVYLDVTNYVVKFLACFVGPHVRSEVGSTHYGAQYFNHHRQTVAFVATCSMQQYYA